LGIQPEKFNGGWFWELPPLVTDAVVEEAPEAASASTVEIEIQSVANPTGALHNTDWGRAFMKSSAYSAALVRVFKRLPALHSADLAVALRQTTARCPTTHRRNWMRS
jgi:hypothetical protein